MNCGDLLKTKKNELSKNFNNYFSNLFPKKISFASDFMDGKTTFRNVCEGCHVRGGLVVLKGSKSLKLPDL